MDKKNNFKAVCFGEVLWDVFPSYKKNGGAGRNFQIDIVCFVGQSKIQSDGCQFKSPLLYYGSALGIDVKSGFYQA